MLTMTFHERKAERKEYYMKYVGNIVTGKQIGRAHV